MRFALSDDVSDDELEEEEPAHPMGFKSPLGRTWFSLEPPSQSQVDAAFGRSTYAWLDDSDDSDDEESKENKVHIQSYPPLSSYIRSETATTAALLNAHLQLRSAQKSRRLLPLLAYKEQDDELKYSDDEEKENDQSTNALISLSSPSVPPPIPAAIQQALSPPPPSQRHSTERTIQQKIQTERQRVDDECRRNIEILSKLVLKSENEAAAILKRRQAQEEKIRQAQEARDEQERQAQAARDVQAAKAQEEKEKLDRQNKEERAAAVQHQQELALEAKKKVEYIEKAKERVKYSIQVRKSVEPFEENKALGKRRLGMKKIARGKLNTLSESAEKVHQVATEVSQAISQARQDDAAAKQALEQKQPGVTPDMKIGKRYLLDLIAADTMTRVQAETFNGIKGDAFPLATMLSMVSVENKDFAPILEGHVYMVCPTAIPTLPAPEPNASEDDLMAGLGMQRKKDGEFESFPEFLARTENIISFMADIQASLPSSNVLMGGNVGAVKWLTRFLDLLPPPPSSPLPLITAPVLTAFLTGAGHMLANKHADAFKKMLDTISKEVVNRLDEGEIGKPSSIRLNKIVAGGFENFRTSLPMKAIPELYYGASGESKKHTEGSVFGGTIGQDDEQEGENVRAFQNPFSGQSLQSTHFSTGKSSGSASPPNPFGAPGGSSPNIPTNSFGAASSISSTSQNPFGSTAAAPSPSPFSSSNQGASPSPFTSTNNNGPLQTTPFGSTPSSNTAFGVSAVNASPFGGGSTSNTNKSPSAAPTPFGGINAAAPSSLAFGGNQSSTTHPSPFGGSAPNPSPFGGGNNLSSQTPFSNQNPSSFGGGGSNNLFGSPNANPGPFGASAPSASPFPTQTPSPFGNTGAASQPFESSTNVTSSPFRGGQMASSPSPFGRGMNAPSPSPFGGGQSAPSPSPFSNQNPSPFGGASSTTFGTSGANATPFGSSAGTNPSPFGGGLNALSPSPFSTQNASPFGSNGATQPFGSGSINKSPFGSSTFRGSSGFGGNSQQNQAFDSGSGSNKQPCRFFAKGQCRFGANCRYSHEVGAGGNTNAFGGGNSVFGSGASGGLGGGGFGTNTPFGGPRR
ncbi:GLE1-like protein [Nitzschia inconspicua]|uniref:GLE1-like protein n=1 Tax=Nitzschia inconspicua TaxID=303405 RepID=A0A9K3PX56_9STRA|nr:GLE1-like protein [Nitzschia inconspicua]